MDTVSNQKMKTFPIVAIAENVALGVVNNLFITTVPDILKLGMTQSGNNRVRSM